MKVVDRYTIELILTWSNEKQVFQSQCLRHGWGPSKDAILMAKRRILHCHKPLTVQKEDVSTRDK